MTKKNKNKNKAAAGIANTEAPEAKKPKRTRRRISMRERISGSVGDLSSLVGRMQAGDVNARIKSGECVDSATAKKLRAEYTMLSRAKGAILKYGLAEAGEVTEVMGQLTQSISLAVYGGAGPKPSKEASKMQKHIDALLAMVAAASEEEEEEEGEEEEEESDDDEGEWEEDEEEEEG